jgi:hypothetical protein
LDLHDKATVVFIKNKHNDNLPTTLAHRNFSYIFSDRGLS